MPSPILPQDSSPTKPKIYFSHSSLPPSYLLDGGKNFQPGKKKREPFSTFETVGCVHTLDLVLPEEIWDVVRRRVVGDEKVPENGRASNENARGMLGVYARVHMKLEEILDPEFLETYIKKGNIVMLSEGRPLVDNLISLQDGILRLELDRPTYERCGLQGVPIEDGGRKHQKQRYVITHDLRPPSLRPSKPLYTRLHHAATTALPHTLTFLIHNLNLPAPAFRESLSNTNDPLAKHHPTLHQIRPSLSHAPRTLIPAALDHPRRISEIAYEEYENAALHEYAEILCLGSSRVSADDSVDEHLCRYEVPTLIYDVNGEGNGDKLVRTRDMVRVRWRGFIPPVFVRRVFLEVKRCGLGGGRNGNRMRLEDGDRQGDDSHHEEGDDVDMMDGSQNERKKKEEREEAWMVMRGNGFGGRRAWCVMQWARSDTLTWETEL